MVEELLCNGSVTSTPLSPQDPHGLPIPLHHCRPPFVQDPGASPGLHRPTVMLGDPANTSPLFFSCRALRGSLILIQLDVGLHGR